MSDEQILTGMLESISAAKTGKDKNNKDYTSYYMTINGQTYSAYNPTFNLPIKGDEVEIKYIVNGNYKNLNELRILGPNDQVQSVNPPVVRPETLQPVESQIEQVPTPQAAPAQPIPQVVNNHNSMNERDASIVSQCLIKCVSEMVAHKAIEPGKLKSNLDVLIDAYKTTKQRLLE